ncbi:MAG: CoA transferase subunit A [Chloroflexota bacterium]
MKEKLMTLREAAALIPSGSSVTIGGAAHRRSPMAFVYELIRRRPRDLQITALAGGVAVDALIGAGCVKRVESMYVGLEMYGLAPNFRRAVERGELVMEDWTESSIITRFRAAAFGVPFMPTRALLGSSHAEYASSENIKPIQCPFTGEKLYAVRAAKTDFTVLHGYYGDKYGNVQRPVRRDTDDVDREIAQAASKLIVTVEKVVPHEEVLANSTLTYIPGRWVTAIVEAPFGAHPGYCDGLYSEDEEANREYAASAKEPERMQEWLDKYVYSVADHFEYLDKMGGLRVLSSKLRV